MIQQMKPGVWFEAAGAPGAPAIAFLHGAAGTHAMWQPQMRMLADDFRVVAPDLPGHGALAHLPFTLDAAVQAVADAIDAAAGGRAVVAGLSLGGYVAMAHAARYPQQVAGLVLSGCSIDYRGAIGVLSRLDAWLVLRLFSERRLLGMQDKALRRMFPDDLADSLVAAGFTFRTMPAVYRELASCDFGPLLRQFLGPVLILNGERDRLNRRVERRQLQAARDGRLQIIAGAGHACNLEQPHAFSQAVREFASATYLSSRARE
jgi:pimeloyl-ACP methyl ester carboxylesterase